MSRHSEENNDLPADSVARLDSTTRSHHSGGSDALPTINHSGSPGPGPMSSRHTLGTHTRSATPITSLPTELGPTQQDCWSAYQYHSRLFPEGEWHLSAQFIGVPLYYYENSPQERERVEHNVALAIQKWRPERHGVPITNHPDRDEWKNFKKSQELLTNAVRVDDLGVSRSSRSSDEPDLYVPRSSLIKSFRDHLIHLAEDFSIRVTLPLPRWGRDFVPSVRPMSRNDAQMAAVLYRFEAEEYIHYIITRYESFTSNKKGKTPVRPFARASGHAGTSGLDTIYERQDHSQPTPWMESTPQPRRITRFSEAVENITPISRAYTHLNGFNASTFTPMDVPENFEEVRRQQAHERVPRASLIDTTHLARGGFGNLFEEPTFDNDRTLENMYVRPINVPEGAFTSTPRATPNVRNSAHPVERSRFVTTPRALGGRDAHYAPPASNDSRYEPFRRDDDDRDRSPPSGGGSGSFPPPLLPPNPPPSPPPSPPPGVPGSPLLRLFGPNRPPSPPPNFPPIIGAPGSDAGRGVRPFVMEPIHFDRKLKPEVVEEWDGNPDTISKWISTVNMVARRGPLVYEGLGDVVPSRLKGRAKNWYFGLSQEVRRDVSRNWGTLRQAIGTYFMNRAWLDKQRTRAISMKYREVGHERESPSDYFHRKLELLQLAHGMDDSQLIMEIMNGAPAYWFQIMDTSRMRDVGDLQTLIQYHEDRLRRTNTEESRVDELEKRLKSLEYSKNRYSDSKTTTPGGNFQRNNARAMLVGSHPKLPNPTHEKDDSVVSKKTPESMGARPCRHCGSGKHWDNDCRWSTRGPRKARAMLASSEPDYIEAQLEYEQLWCDADEDEGPEDDTNQDFSRPSE